MSKCAMLMMRPTVWWMIYLSVVWKSVWTWNGPKYNNKFNSSVLTRVTWTKGVKATWALRQTYCDRLSHWLVCIWPAVSQFLHHRWCRAGRGQGSFPGQSRYRPNTPRTPCRDCVRSARTHPGLPGTPYTAHTGLIWRWRSSCSRRRRWHRWSRCRASPSASGRYTECRDCTPLCDCSSLRRSHLQTRGQVEEDETEKWGGNERRGKEWRRLEDGESRKYEEINRRINSESNDINHVYCTFIRREDTLIHWALSDLCSGTRKVLLLGSESKACCSLRYRSWCVCAACWVNRFNLSYTHRVKCRCFDMFTLMHGW